MTRTLAISMAVVLTAGLCGACSKDDDGVSPGNATLARRPNACVHVDPAAIDPADFVSDITNPYLPFTPGTEYVYRSDDGSEETRTFVTHDTRVIEGVTTTVVHDRVFTDGELTEDTFDWYAQDKDGNVWYFGEDTKELENGVVVSISPDHIDVVDKEGCTILSVSWVQAGLEAVTNRNDIPPARISHLPTDWQPRA